MYDALAARYDLVHPDWEPGGRGSTVDAEPADMRTVGWSVEGRFDAVIALDNSPRHLLSDEDLTTALRGFRDLIEPEGRLLVSVRDYETVDRSPRSTHPYGARTRGGRTFHHSQEWRGTDPERYRTTMIVEEEEVGVWTEVVRGSPRYYAIPVPRLLALRTASGFEAERERSVDFFQPLISGWPR